MKTKKIIWMGYFCIGLLLSSSYLSAETPEWMNKAKARLAAADQGIHTEVSYVNVRWTGPQILDTWTEFSVLRVAYILKFQNNWELHAGLLQGLNVQNQQKSAEFQYIDNQARIHDQKFVNLSLNDGWFFEYSRQERLVENIFWHAGVGFENIEFAEQKLYANLSNTLNRRGQAAIPIRTLDGFFGLHVNPLPHITLGGSYRVYLPQSAYVSSGKPKLGQKFTPFNRLTVMPAPLGAMYLQYSF